MAQNKLCRLLICQNIIMDFTRESEINCFREQLVQCHSLLDNYKWLTDSFVIDFFTCDHWSSVPVLWKSLFESLPPADLGDAILDPSSITSKLVYPLSLLSFQAVCNNLALERTALSNLDPVLEYLHQQNFHCGKSKCDWGIENQSSAQQKSLNQIFNKNIKPKKQHELKQMSETCSLTSSFTGCQTVVDVGAGVGHLSRQLSLRHGLNVICLECQSEFNNQAEKLDVQHVKSLSKLGLTIGPLPKHVTLTLNPDTTNLKVLIDEKLGQCVPEFGLVGLHTCGDLGPTLIRNFVNVPEIKFILAIGCCYMKMNFEPSSEIRNFPMSNFVRKLKPFVSYEALEVACHALESYRQRLKDINEVEKLKVHCYRATLETLLVQSSPPVRRAGLRSVKNAHLLSFEDYVEKALDKTGLHVDAAARNSVHIQACLSQWRAVVVFYSLRLLLAPIVETVIQLDRLLYLAENGLRGCLLPLFDCRTSPRNFALLCVKPQLDPA